MSSEMGNQIPQIIPNSLNITMRKLLYLPPFIIGQHRPPSGSHFQRSFCCQLVNNSEEMSAINFCYFSTTFWGFAKINKAKLCYVMLW